MRTHTTILLAALAALSGCACDAVPAGALQSCEVGAVVPEAVQTDILFVIDDSPSMEQEQANLRDNLSAFIDALVASPVANDFRIGVVSTSIDGFTLGGTTPQAYTAGPAADVPYPDGALVAIHQDGAGAGIAGDLIYDAATSTWGGARVLARGDGAPATLAALARDFKANVLLGTDGSGKEQPFRAARLALSDRLADANAGFLRPGARLAIFFLTDEDDCSDSAAPQRTTSNIQCRATAQKFADPPEMDRVEDFVAFLNGPIDGELREVRVAAVAGFAPSSSDPAVLVPALCSTASGQASDEAERFAALAAAPGAPPTRLGSICSASFADTLRAFAEDLRPSSLPLAGAPADWRMLAVRLLKAGGDPAGVTCAVAEAGTAAAGAADAVYAPPGFGRPAQLTFQNACALGLGDRIDVRIVCVN